MALSKIIAEGVDLTDTFAFTGTVTGAGEITASSTAPSEGGAATTNVVQGLAKCWTRFDPSANIEQDSLNQSSRSDDGTGFSTINFVNIMNNAYYSGHQQCADYTAPTTGSGAHISAVFGEVTSSVRAAYGYSGNSGGITWAFNDHTNQKFVLHGDLA